MRRKIYLTLLTLLFVQDLLGQCAMCKAVAEDAAEQESSNINQAIMYIMIIPYIILFIAFRKQIVAFFRKFKEIPAETGAQKKS